MSGQLIRHANFERALARVHDHASTAPRGTLIWVVGPSGIGKTELATELATSLVAPRSTWAPGKVHVIKVSCRNSDRSFYSSKDLLQRMLIASGCAITASAMVPDVMELGWEQQEQTGRWAVKSSSAEHVLALRLERGAPIRETKFVIIDNADDMTITQKTRNPAEHLISLRGLIFEMQAVGILLGTYDLLKLWNATAQLNERCAPVQFERYRCDDKASLQSFAELALRIQQRYPMVPAKLVKKEIRFLYANTLGVYGGLNRMFRNSTAEAIAQGLASVTVEILHGAGLTLEQLSTLHEEIHQGESRIQPASQQQAIGLLRTRDMSPAPASKESGRKPRKSRRCGIRNAKRDPVGGIERAARQP